MPHPLSDPTPPPDSDRPGRRCSTLLWLAAVLVWSIAAPVILVRGGLASSHHHHTVISTYEGAGRHWIEGKPLYEGTQGFVYSPLVAAFFAPLAFIPAAVSYPLWLLFSMAAFAGSVRWCLRTRLFPDAGVERGPLVFLLMLPLALGNFSNGQVNPLVIALLLSAIVALRKQWFGLAALCVALGVYFKIYPIALGLVLLVAYPREFSWRFVLALAALAGLSFLLQRPAYVWSQYHLWFATRLADDRANAGIVRNIFQIFAALHLPLGRNLQLLLQAGSGAAIAVLAVLGRFRFRWSEARVLLAIFCLVDAWMLLFGPATESATYVMLAPAVVLALAQSIGQPLPRWMTSVVVAALGVLLSGTAINSFLRLEKTPLVMSVQPLGALLFAGFVVLWVLRNDFWPRPALE